MNTGAHIVVGYDGRPDSVAALTWAAKAASLRGEAVVATTIIDPREFARGIAWPESYWADVDDKARGVLAPWPEVPLRTERHTGHMIPTLVDVARNGSMLVVGSKGHGLVAEMLRGSVSQSAARHAAVPVVVVRAPQNPNSGRIVVGSDGSEASARALEFACEMARLTGDKVVALRAWHPTEAAPERHGYLPPPSVDSMDAAESAVGQTVDQARGAHPEVAIESEVYAGPPEQGLIDASGNASLVVVGSQGRSAVDEVLMGSVSKAVLHKAHSPVAVVH
jgi:nucleotide-binding universal stress UspA family protein